MAFLPFDPNRAAQQPGSQGSPAPVNISGGSSVINTGQNTPQAQTAKSQASDASGAFVNLQSYLEANRPQAAELGSQVAGSVANKAEAAKAQVGNLESAFNQKVNESKVTANKSLIDEAVFNPMAVVADQQKKSEIDRMRTANYSGPQALEDLSDYSTTQTKLNEANQSVKGLESEQGRQTALAEQFKRPTYSRGQQSLDQLLLQNSPEGRTAIDEVRQRYSTLEGALTGANQQASQLAQAAKSETDQARTQVQEAFGRKDDPTTLVDERTGAFGNIQSDLENKTKSFAESQASLASRLREQSASASLDNDILSLLGLSEGANIYDLDLASIANPQFDNSNVSIQRVANEDDYNRYLALSQLAGVDPSLLVDRSLAGTAQGAQVNRSALEQSLANRASLATQRQQEQLAAEQALNAFNANIGEGEIREINLMMPQNASRYAALQAALANSQAAYNALQPTRTVTRRNS